MATSGTATTTRIATSVTTTVVVDASSTNSTGSVIWLRRNGVGPAGFVSDRIGDVGVLVPGTEDDTASPHDDDHQPARILPQSITLGISRSLPRVGGPVPGPPLRLADVGLGGDEPRAFRRRRCEPAARRSHSSPRGPRSHLSNSVNRRPPLVLEDR